MTENATPLSSIEDRHYTNPPVTEALCELYFKGSSWANDIPDRFHERIRGDYPKQSQVVVGGIQFLHAQGPGGGAHLSPGALRLRFSREDESRLIQLSHDLLVVNQLVTPSCRYPRFEDWRGEVLNALAVYRELAAPTGIDRLGVRYINWVHIPLSGELLPMDRYFCIYPQIPAELGNVHGAFMLQMVMFPKCPGHELMLTFANNQRDEEVGKRSFLLDLYDAVPMGGRDAFGDIQRLLDEAHTNIVNTFEHMITDDLRKQFGEAPHV